MIAPTVLLPSDLSGRRVAVAMSGGVDSSVAAALLQEAGAEVVGLSLRLYDIDDAGENARSCCAPEDLYEARAVAQELGIAHYVLDATESFARDVVADFVDSYLRGETPNPCVRCNERTKFRDLLHRSRTLGCAALVTGHYARIEASDGVLVLRRARDLARDQSYFLFTLGQEELAETCFPLAELTKDEVREIARAKGLPVADKPDSMEVCFVGGGRAADFVERVALRAPRPGPIVDDAGRVLGMHGGVHRYTVGQRHGLGISGPEPYYVVAIDADTQTVRVGPRDAVTARECWVDDLRWAVGEPPTALEAQVQIRSRSAPVLASVQLAGGTARVLFREPVRAIAPGQAAVIYDGDRVLGGGWIRGGRVQ